MTQPAAPAILARWLAPFATLFTRPTWQNLLGHRQVNEPNVELAA
jgi:hypothetical protein